MNSLKLRLLHINDDPFELEEVESRLTGVSSPCAFALSSFSDPIKIPRLRDRPGKIAALAEHFCIIVEGGPNRSSPASEALCADDWRKGKAHRNE